MTTPRSITTLVIFLLSSVVVIFPFSFPARLPWIGTRRIHVGLNSAPIFAIALLWVAQCLGPTQIRDGIVGDDIKPYNILILFISLAYMAITLDITGVLRAAAFWVSNRGGSSGRHLYLYFYLLLTLLSVVLGNDPVILSGTVFLVYFAQASSIQPIAWLFAEFAAANTASMVLFIGNPTNVVITEGFHIHEAGFTLYTILPFLGCILSCFLALAIQFRGETYVPRSIPGVAYLDPRSAIEDPIGAWVGSIILSACLVTLMIASFFGVEVWVITLPFAVAKLIFDLVWDLYRTPRLTRSTADTSDAQGIELQSPAKGASDISPKSAGEDPRSPLQRKKDHICRSFTLHFPTVSTAIPRLPLGLVPFAFSQFILIEALAHQGWIDVFGQWFSIATKDQLHAAIWLSGTLCIVLCSVSGTNIGATILLTKVIHVSPSLSTQTIRASGIAIAIASNIGAVSAVFSASLAGLLWRRVLRDKGIVIGQRTFAKWNLFPLLVMTVVGLGIVSAEFEVLRHLKRQ